MTNILRMIQRTIIGRGQNLIYQGDTHRALVSPISIGEAKIYISEIEVNTATRPILKAWVAPDVDPTDGDIVSTAGYDYTVAFKRTLQLGDVVLSRFLILLVDQPTDPGPGEPPA